jgi:DNA-binding transcriptional MerR regulator
MSIEIDSETYYTVGEVAAAAGKTPQTIKRWASQGKIPKPRRLKTSNWRIYSQADKEKIVNYSKQIV